MSHHSHPSPPELRAAKRRKALALFAAKFAPDLDEIDQRLAEIDDDERPDRHKPTT